VSNNTNTVRIGKHFQQFLINDPDNGDIAMATAAYPFTTASTNLYYKMLNNSADSTAAFRALCPDKNCAAVMIEISQSSIFQPINTQQTSLYALSSQYVMDSSTGKATTQKRTVCIDAISFPTAFERMAGRPPVKLNMPFYNCHNTPETALLSSIGIGQGYAALATGIVMGLIGFFVTFYINGCKATSESELLLSAKSRERREMKETRRLLRALVQNQSAQAPVLAELVKGSREKAVEKWIEYQYNESQFDLNLKAPPKSFVASQSSLLLPQGTTASSGKEDGGLYRRRATSSLPKRRQERNNLDLSESDFDASSSESESDSEGIPPRRLPAAAGVRQQIKVSSTDQVESGIVCGL